MQLPHVAILRKKVHDTQATEKQYLAGYPCEHLRNLYKDA